MLCTIPLGVLLSGESPIDLDGSLIVQFLIFWVAFFMLRGLVFRPVMGLFDAREQAMQGSQDEAAQLQQKAEQTREHFEAELRRVRAKATENREQLRSQAQQLARELTETARRENNATLSSAKAQLDVEAKDARKKADGEVPVLARQIAEHLLGRSVS
jgi:F-type H+-transporting ATPase subunit b